MRLIKLAILISLFVLCSIEFTRAMAIYDIGFKPDVNAFSFPNWGGGNTTAGLTPYEMWRMFGDEVIASRMDGKYILTPAAKRWMDEANRAMAHGHCEGMAVLSALMYFDKVSPSEFGGSDAYQLSLKDEQLQREIAYWWTTQVTTPGGSQKVKESPNAVLDILAKAFEDGPKANEWWVLGLYKPDGTGGHSVTPYAVEETDNATAKILIYDNNFPKQIRAVEINRKENTWEYQTSTTPNESSTLYTGDASTHSLEIAAISPRLGPQRCEFCEDGGNASLAGSKGSLVGENNAQVWVDGNGQFLITDKYGQRIGFLESGIFVDEIPNANRTILKFAENEDTSVFSIPLGKDYSIEFDQNMNGMWLFAPGTSMGFDNQGNGGSVQVSGIGTNNTKAISQTDNSFLTLSGAKTETTFNNIPSNTSVEKNTTDNTITIILGSPGTINADTTVINNNGVFSSSEVIPVLLNDVAQMDIGNSVIEITYSNGTQQTYNMNLEVMTDKCYGVVCLASECQTPGTCNPANGKCTDPTTKADGAACTDGDACTQTDTCQNGKCTSGSPVVCTAQDACHVAGTCDRATGCSNPAAPDSTSCSDGNACTTGDTCSEGSCKPGATTDCDDGNACTDDSCNSATGCVYTNNAAACDDGNACTQTDTCQAGACTGSNPVVCSECQTPGTCNPATGECTPLTDGTGCSGGGSCVSGACQAASCTDGMKNDGESGIDCGGTSACGLCADGKACASGSDCTSAVCDAKTHTCSAASCTDGMKNDGESGIDCGGTSTCGLCADGKACKSGSDCTSGVCTGNVCQAASCTDGMKNDGESGIDCGGTSTCGKCGTDKACTSPSDCTSGVCTSNVCQAASCTDNVKNDGETDIDCGGSSCSACADSKACTSPSDCTSEVCDATTHTCSAATCADSVKNGDETDADCGGSCPNKCSDSKSCTQAGDCTSGHCVSDVCVECAQASDCTSGVCDAITHTCSAASCTDNVKNGDETGIDCGGSCPAKCADGQACTLASDCASGVSTSGVCQAASCTDNVKNGGETGIDCGGLSCPACPTCSDGIKNGGETGVDCGGPCSAPCPVDCQMSDWSTWDACSEECGGTQERTRTVTTEPLYGGAACPALSESLACNTDPGTPCTGGLCDGSGVCDKCAVVTCNAPPVCYSTDDATCDEGICSYPTEAASGTPCTGGLCEDGACVDQCVKNSVSCSASACQTEGTCNPQTGLCTTNEFAGTVKNGDACNYNCQCRSGHCHTNGKCTSSS